MSVLRRSTVLADAYASSRESRAQRMQIAPTLVQVGAAATSSSTIVHTGMSSSSIAMALLAGIGLGGIVLLATAKPFYAGLALLGGLFIGSRLGSETGA